MKTSLRKLRGFALPKHEAKERRRPLAQLDELAQATQDLQDMRDCYDALLSAAAATANSVYEFSESLQEIGACLLEKTALNDDEESGAVLLMLGKVQFVLQKLVDSYRSHIFQTITIPSESLLNTLQEVEEMKQKCDEKRLLYEDMKMRQREKGRSRGGKNETYSAQQLKAAYEEYDDGASEFIFRVKSLKQGQSRSLLTEAARHHAAQLSFFRKAVKSLEVVEPHVRLVTQQQHINYYFSGLDDDDSEGDDDYDDDGSSDARDDGELSFDNGQNDQGGNVISPSRNSMEVDQVDLTFPQPTVAETAKEHHYQGHGDALSFSDEYRAASQSAPIFYEQKLDPAERIRQIQPSATRKFHSYVLPTPNATKTSSSSGSGTPVSLTKQTSLTARTHNLWHTSPLEGKRDEKVLRSQSVLRESNNNSASTRLPLPLAEGKSFQQLDQRVYSDAKKIKRQAFSGPLSKPWSAKRTSFASGPFAPVGHPQLFSGPLLRTPTPQPSSVSPKVSASASPPIISPPKISELHELPRPPASLISKYGRPSGLVGHSAPLVSKGQEVSATNKYKVSNVASPLPIPPQAIARSFSIPSRVPRGTEMNSKPLEASQISEMVEDFKSPPLTPISLPRNIHTN